MHVTEKDRSVKTLLLVSNTSFYNEISGGNVWVESAFFKDVKKNFGMEKVNFREYTIFYINQAQSTVQKGDKMLYANYFILGQVIPAANVPDEVDNYRCSAGKLKIIELLYDPETGQFN